MLSMCSALLWLGILVPKATKRREIVVQKRRAFCMARRCVGGACCMGKCICSWFGA